MDELTWTTRTPAPGDRHEAPGLALTAEALPAAALVSGDLQAAIDALAPGAAMVGLGGQIGSGAYALRAARDRALLCLPASAGLQPGWHAPGFAVTPAGDAWMRFRIEGNNAGALLAEGCSAGLDASSPSAAATFAGLTCLIAYDSDAALVWAERGMAAYLWSWLCLERA